MAFEKIKQGDEATQAQGGCFSGKVFIPGWSVYYTLEKTFKTSYWDTLVGIAMFQLIEPKLHPALLCLLYLSVDMIQIRYK